MKSNSRSFILAFLAVLVLAIGYWFFTTKAYVEGYRITRKQVFIRNEIVKIYDPKETRSLGLDQLIRARVRYSILKKNGILINENDLKAEAQRISNTTQAPYKLESIRKLFGTDEEDYLEVFVLPSLVEQKIYSLASYGNKEFHKESYLKAESFIQSLKNLELKDFKSKALESEAEFRELTLSTKKGLLWVNPGQKIKLGREPRFHDVERGKKLFDEVFKNMKAGQIVAAPVDYDDAWLVPLLLKIQNEKSDLILKIEVAIFLKMDISQWVERESKMIPVMRF